jgi:hypothetical protein
VDTCRFIIEFTVGDEVNIEERIAPSDATSQPLVPNPVLERLRSALNADERVVLRRVASVIRVGDRPRQELLVWVEVFCGNSDDGLRTAREAVCDVVGRVIPSTTYSGFEDVDRSGGQLW